MSEITEQSPAGDVQPSAEDKTDAMRIQLLEAKNLELKNEKQAVRKQMEDMERRLQEMQQGQQKEKQQNLVKNQEFEVLWKEASQSNSSLQEQLAERDQQIASMKVEAQQAQIKQVAMSAIAQNGVVNPAQAFDLLQKDLRMNSDGNVIALYGGVEVDLNSHLNNLKQPGSGWEHHFAGTGARGMSAVGSSPNTAGGKSWSGMSLTEQIAMLNDQPEAAARLQAQG